METLQTHPYIFKFANAKSDKKAGSDGDPQEFLSLLNQGEGKELVDGKEPGKNGIPKINIKSITKQDLQGQKNPLQLKVTEAEEKSRFGKAELFTPLDMEQIKVEPDTLQNKGGELVDENLGLLLEKKLKAGEIDPSLFSTTQTGQGNVLPIEETLVNEDKKDLVRSSLSSHAHKLESPGEQVASVGKQAQEVADWDPYKWSLEKSSFENNPYIEKNPKSETSETKGPANFQYKSIFSGSHEKTNGNIQKDVDASRDFRPENNLSGQIISEGDLQEQKIKTNFKREQNKQEILQKVSLDLAPSTGLDETPGSSTPDLGKTPEINQTRSMNPTAFKMSQIDSANSQEIMGQIRDHVIQMAEAKRDHAEITVNSREFGQFKVEVDRRNKLKGDLEITLSVRDPKAHEIFSENKMGLLKHLDDSGLKIIDLRVQSLNLGPGVLGKEESNTSLSGFASSQGSGYNQDHDGSRSDSQRRRELWDEARKARS